MNSTINGNILTYRFAANESTDNIHLITLPDGYSFESVMVLSFDNISSFESYLSPVVNINYNFPPINSHSPCTLRIYIRDATLSASLRLLITKFGQIPDTHYFDNAFEPILVTGEDGNEYNVIPSDQFK